MLRNPFRPLLRPLLRLPTDAAYGGGAVTLSALIAALYPSAEDGAVYEGDFASGYQDSAGTTAVAAANDPVGLRLDKRLGATPGPELIANGDFSGGTTTGWTPSGSATLSVVAGSLRVTNSSGGTLTSYGSYSITTVVGKSYVVNGQITDNPAGLALLSIMAGSSPATADMGRKDLTTGLPGAFSQFRFTATATTVIITLVGWSTPAAGYVSWDNISTKLLDGNHAIQATAGSRPLDVLAGSNYADQLDGLDDSQAAVAGGGGTTGFFWCGAVKVIGGAGGSRSVWSDTGTNSGYRVRIASTNKLALGAGDGVAFTSATTTDAVDVGNTYVLCVWDDGANLNAQVNLGTVVSVARPVVTAGTASFTRGKENGAATLFANISILAEFYKKNGSVNAATRLATQQYCAAKAGLSI